jgi:hypothetical protein
MDRAEDALVYDVRDRRISTLVAKTDIDLTLAVNDMINGQVSRAH